MAKRKKLMFIDTSAYLSMLIPADKNHKKAKKLAKDYKDFGFVTSSGVLSELATIGSMHYDKKETLAFINKIFEGDTMIVIETEQLVNKIFAILSSLRVTNVSWVDCYTYAVMEHLGIKYIFTFNKDFEKLLKRKKLIK